MTQRIVIIEPDARPARAELQVPVGELFSVYLMEDALASRSGLRSTILRRGEEHPPAGSMLVMEVQLLDPERALSPMRVKRVGPRLELEIVRPDMRSRVSATTELRIDNRIELSLPGQRRLVFGLQLASQTRRDAVSTIGGVGTQGRKTQLAVEGGALWLVPPAWSLMRDLADTIRANVKDVMKRLGLSPRVIGIIVAGFFLFVPWYLQRRQTAAAREENANLTQSLELARAANATSLESELACLDERQALATRLGEAEEVRRLAAEMALATTSAQTVALEQGGPRMGTEQVIEHDLATRPGLVSLIMGSMVTLGEYAGEPARCLTHDSVLGSDLPRYLLYFSPDPGLLCPREYEAVIDNVDVAGRWGLSTRVADEFDQDQPMTGGEEREGRANDRRSARMLAAAQRTMQNALLGHEAGGRPPVIPSQAQLWSLALVGAYNLMPAPMEGATDNDLPQCVEQLLDDLVEQAGPAAPGEPLLPDIVQTVSGEDRPSVRSTTECPWPEDALGVGAEAAVRAVAHMASMGGDGAAGNP